MKKFQIETLLIALGVLLVLSIAGKQCWEQVVYATSCNYTVQQQDDTCDQVSDPPCNQTKPCLESDTPVQSFGSCGFSSYQFYDFKPNKAFAGGSSKANHQGSPTCYAEYPCVTTQSTNGYCQNGVMVSDPDSEKHVYNCCENSASYHTIEVYEAESCGEG
jgi:hypothetical protein